MVAVAGPTSVMGWHVVSWRHCGVVGLLRWRIIAPSWSWPLHRRMRDVKMLALRPGAHSEHHHLMRWLSGLRSLVDHHGRRSAGARIAA